MTRILIADPDFRTRQAFTLLLERRLGARCVGEAWDRASLHRQLETCQADLLLLDCYLPGLSMAEMAALALPPAAARLVLTSVNDDDILIAQAMVVPFIYKGSLPDEVLATLRALIPEGTTDHVCSTLRS